MAKKSKRKHPGITEKRMNNRRFRKTEDAIVRAFFDCGACAGMSEVARRAGMARSTVYYHHSAVREILPDYKRYIIRDYTRMIGKMLRKKQMRMKQVFLTILAFMARNRGIFMLFAKVHDTEVMREMMGRLRGKVESFARLPRNSDKIFQVYRGEVVAVLERWGEDGYKDGKMTEVLGDMMYLTETARVRLGRLAE